MAEEKEKPKEGGGKPKESKPAQRDLFADLVAALFILIVLSSLVNGIVNFINGSSIFRGGWSGLTARGITLADTRPMASLFNPIGASVLVSKDSTDVLDDAGGKKVGTQPFGAKGKVTKGPVNIGGVNYYYVDFETGQDGWVAEDSIVARNTQVRPLQTSDPLGSTVMTSHDGTKVLDGPGGNVIATKSQNARGTITKGPVKKDGVNYYYVQFDDGTSGWVRQDDLLVDAPIEPSPLAKAVLFFWWLVSFMKYLLLLLIFIMFVAIGILVRRLTKIRVNNREKLYPILAKTLPKASINPKWERVLTHIESINENDWRLAVIEADIMLSELLDTMHLVGDSIGEKLKGVERSDFTTIDAAWEAHKVRNQIAHDGGDFHLTQREALRVIELYRSVFHEFQFI